MSGRRIALQDGQVLTGRPAGPFVGVDRAAGPDRSAAWFWPLDALPAIRNAALRAVVADFRRNGPIARALCALLPPAPAGRLAPLTEAQRTEIRDYFRRRHEGHRCGL